MIPRRFAILSNNAFSLLNFRGPLLAEIASRGHKVFALAPDITPAMKSELRALGVEPVDANISRTGLNPIRDIRDMLRLTRILYDLRLDAVLSFAIKPVIYGTFAARMVAVPHRYALIAGLGYSFGVEKGFGLKRRIVHQTAKALYKLALAQVSSTFMQNPDDVEDFVRLSILPRGKMVLVDGTGVDLEAWPMLAPRTDRVTFVLAARLLSEKGVRDYVNAARLVKAKSPKVHFLLLGSLDSNPDGISRSEVDRWVREGLVEWPGHVDVRPWLAQSSVFVLPSYYREGIPRSIQEALASGRPVITADTPGCRETVLNGINGFLIPPRAPEDLAAAMQRFVDNPDLIVDMGQQSRLIAQSRFDVHQINARMIEVMGL